MRNHRRPAWALGLGCMWQTHHGKGHETGHKKGVTQAVAGRRCGDPPPKVGGQEQALTCIAPACLVNPQPS